MKNIGNRLEELMLQKNINRSTLAKMCKVSPTTITNCIENDTIKSDLLAKIVKALDTSADYLLFGNKYTDRVEEKLLEAFRSLNSENQLKVVKETIGLKGIQELEDLQKKD